MRARAAEHDTAREKHAYEKGKLETELKQTCKEYAALQSEFNTAQQERTKAKDSLSTAECSRPECKKKLSDSDGQLQRKAKQIYDLTVRLGCIDQENKELKVLIEDKVSLFEGRLETQRQQAEQDISEACAQIETLRKMLDETESKLKHSKPIAVTCTVSQQTDYVAFYPSSATFCELD